MIKQTKGKFVRSFGIEKDFGAKNGLFQSIGDDNFSSTKPIKKKAEDEVRKPTEDEVKMAKEILSSIKNNEVNQGKSIKDIGQKVSLKREAQIPSVAAAEQQESLAKAFDDFNKALSNYESTGTSPNPQTETGPKRSR